MGELFTHIENQDNQLDVSCNDPHLFIHSLISHTSTNHNQGHVMEKLCTPTMQSADQPAVLVKPLSEDVFERVESKDLESDIRAFETNEEIISKKKVLKEKLIEEDMIEVKEIINVNSKDNERLEKERLEKERIEKEKNEKERIEKERNEKIRIEKERLEKERFEKEI